MPDVIIHRCRVRVLRRDGWSWGPAPRELVDQVLRWLPQVLAGRLGDLASEGQDVEVTTPVHVTIPIRLDQLGATPDIDVAGEPSIVFDRAAPMAAIEANRVTHLPAGTGVGSSPVATSASPVDRPAAPCAAGETTALARLIHAWRERGILGVLLRRLPTQTVADWHDALVPAQRHARTPATASEDARIDVAVRAAAARLGPAPLESARRLLCRLVVAAEAGAALERSLDDVKLWNVIERVFPVESPPACAVVPDDGLKSGPNSPTMPTPAQRVIDAGLSDEPSLMSPPRRSRGAGRKGTTPTTVPAVIAPRTWDVYVDSALPFLMLEPLAGIGFFDAAAATFEVEELEDAWPTFVAALAYKTLALPDAYGRRVPQAQRDAAACAGSAQPIAETAITALAERTRGKLAALEAVIAHALLSGHTRGQSLLLHALDGRAGWLLAEVAGAFPVACLVSAETLLDWYALIDGELLLVPRLAADPTLMRALNDAGIRFLTDAPPLRSDTWRALRDGGKRWWTNDARTGRGELMRCGRLLSDADETAASVWRSIGLDRPTAPRMPGSDLDRLLTLAASFALGQLAWDLWSGREPTDPLLTLERFASLDARVHFREDAVNVALPMGRRTWDLAEHRLTDDVRQLPWLGGRTLTFSMG